MAEYAPAETVDALLALSAVVTQMGSAMVVLSVPTSTRADKAEVLEELSRLLKTSEEMQKRLQALSVSPSDSGTHQ